MIKPTYHYIGRCPVCNIVLSSVYDMVDDRPFTSAMVFEMVRAGNHVERVPLGSVEIAIDACRCRKGVNDAKSQAEI